MSYMMSGAMGLIGLLALIALGFSFALGIVAFLIPSIKQILLPIAGLSIPFVMVGGFFLYALWPRKKEDTKEESKCQ